MSSAGRPPSQVASCPPQSRSGPQPRCPVHTTAGAISRPRIVRPASQRSKAAIRSVAICWFRKGAAGNRRASAGRRSQVVSSGSRPSRRLMTRRRPRGKSCAFLGARDPEGQGLRGRARECLLPRHGRGGLATFEREVGAELAMDFSGGLCDLRSHAERGEALGQVVSVGGYGEILAGCPGARNGGSVRRRRRWTPGRRR